MKRLEKSIRYREINTSGEDKEKRIDVIIFQDDGFALRPTVLSLSSY